MSLIQTDIEKIAHLARLALDESKVPEHIKNLSNILTLVDKMNAVDTKSVKPLAHPLEATQRLRPDQVTEHDQRDSFQQIAPEVQDGLYLVPKVIE